MELAYLKEFIVMAEYEDLFEASERIYISPSALSRHIKMIEDEMNVKLFERTSRSMKLNRQGEIFLNYAKHMVQMEQNYKTILNCEDTDNENTINLAALISESEGFLACLIDVLKNRNSEYSVYVHGADTVENWERLRRLECDFALVLEHRIEHAGINRINIGKDRLVAVMEKSHPLAQNCRVDAKQLSEEKLLLFFKGSYMYRLCYDFLEKMKKKIRVVMTSYRGETLISLAARGMGVAIVTEQEARHFCDNRVVYLPLEPEVGVNISLVYRQKREMRKIEKEFLECVKDFLK